MSRKSDFGRKTAAYDIDTYGIVRTKTEAKRFRKAKRLKSLQKLARKKNRK